MKMIAMEITTASTMVTATSWRELKIVSAVSRATVMVSPSSAASREATAF